MKVARFGVAALIAVCSASLLAQAGPRRDGKWEVTVQMQMPNMPDMPNMPQGMMGMALPPFTTTQCITKDQALDPQKMIPPRPERGAPPMDCKMADYKTTGNKVNFVVKCTGAQAAEMTGEMVYTADTYVGTMKMSMERGGQPMGMTMKYTGKRLGDCTQ